jgi:anti-sigma factor RsiW
MSSLTEQERADLVAFLDGELDEETSQALEAKLATDADARAELDLLRRTWELLDFLPVPEPSASFTHRTMERIGPTKTGVQTKLARGQWRRWGFGVGWAAAALLAMVGGYLSLTLLLNGNARTHELTDKDLVMDLRVIENKRMYELVDEMEFLKDLDDPDLFGDEQHGGL